MNLEHELIGKQVGSYTAVRYIDRGASALVFEGTGPKGEKIALKVFDPAFIESHGKEVQIERIGRQLILKGHHHDNLIDILDGGQCSRTGYYYIVMTYLPAPTLAKVIDKLPRERIRPLISQVAAAAEFLETLNAYHRDIKPANIVVVGDQFEKAILLDLGVLRPLGLEDLTDNTDKRPFVGTTQYSPPEFLLRDEDESQDGYRAVTFYQIGAVLHDMLMRRPIFHDRLATYGKLVRAVLIEDPVIDCTEAPADLIRLARTCLLKDPAKRLRLVTWDSFRDRDPAEQTISSLKDRVKRLRSTKLDDRTVSGGGVTLGKIAEQTEKSLAASLKQACLDDADTFPPSTYYPGERTGDSSTFGLSFAPSTRHGLDEHLHCMFRVKALQEHPRVIELGFAAGTSSKRFESSAAPIPFQQLGHEVHDGDGHEVCLKKLYEILADALEESVTGPDRDDSGQIAWLKQKG